MRLSEQSEISKCFQSAMGIPDPYVFGPPGSGSGSVSQRYGSGSLYHQAKIVGKENLDSYGFVSFFTTFYLRK
jgi:hypothetical protein